MLDDEINNILEKLDVNLTTLKLRCIFWGKPHDFEKERELKLSAKERINKIKRLKEEIKNNEDELLDYLLDGETKISSSDSLNSKCSLIVFTIFYYITFS